MTISTLKGLDGQIRKALSKIGIYRKLKWKDRLYCSKEQLDMERLVADMNKEKNLTEYKLNKHWNTQINQILKVTEKPPMGNIKRY